MSDSELESAKMNIRSILITYQKGCTLKDLKKDYKSLIGSPIPYAKFGCSSDAEFLKRMPDVVIMTPYGNGEYHLLGIADEKSQHIQKMVSRQKPPKHKPPKLPPPRYRKPYETYTPPPRFQTTSMKKGLSAAMKTDVIDLVNRYPSGLNVSHFESCFEKFYRRKFSFREAGFLTLQECIETIPELTLRNEGNNILIVPKRNFSNANRNASSSQSTVKGHLLSGSIQNGLHAPTAAIIPQSKPVEKNDTFALNNNVSSNSQPQPPAVVSQANKGNRIFHFSAKDNASNNLQSQASAVVSQAEAGKRIFHFSANSNVSSDLPLRNLSDSVPLWKPNDRISHFLDSSNGTSNVVSPSITASSNPLESNSHFQKSLLSGTEKKYEVKKEDFHQSSSKIDTLDNFSLIDLKNNNESSVPESVKMSLKKIMDMHPQGIWATDFPAIYEDVTKTCLDLHSLGYNDLATFLDTLPDILKRKTLDGIKRDWVIYPAEKEEETSTDTLVPKTSVLLKEFIIVTTRKILQAYPEGFKLSDFLHIYSLNCLEPLYIQDFGFDSIENFLLSIADRVPLRLQYNGDYKTVHFVHKPQPNISHIAPKENIREFVPADVAPPDTHIGTLKLPPDFDYDKYFPVYTSSIENPGLLYIQLKGTAYSDALHKLYDDIEVFYHGPESSKYQMHNSDIRVGADCIALWPIDRHWYRVKVLSIPSLDKVQVFYFDYGTKEVIPTTMLRYIRQKYVDLPAQAITSRLAHLKPPHKAPTWDPRTRVRMLKLCQDKVLMAHVHEVDVDGMLSLILCDTNGEVDAYINDTLLNEGLADCITNDDIVSSPSPVPPQPVYTPLQIMQVQSILNAWSTASSTMTHEDLTKLVHTLTMNQQNNLNPLSPIFQQNFSSLQSSAAASSPIPPPNPSLFQSPSSTPSSFPQYHMRQEMKDKEQSLSPLQTLSAFYSNPAKEQTPLRHEIQMKQESVDRSAFVSSPILQSTSSSYNDPYALDPIPVASNSSKLLAQAESEVFSDDDDELFLELYQQVASVMKRFVKRIRTGDGYLFHILIIEGEPFVSSGDISLLIWYNQEPDYLLKRLQNRDVILTSQTVSEDSNEQLFYQIERFHVKGGQKINNTSCILVYPLSSVIQILNMFGQPSIELRRIITSEISSFNQHQPAWQEISEAEFPDKEEEPSRGTDDDKLNKLSLYDLIAMKESIRLRRSETMKNFETNSTNVDKVEKMESLYKKVVERIQQIKQICTMFS